MGGVGGFNSLTGFSSCEGSVLPTAGSRDGTDGLDGVNGLNGARGEGGTAGIGAANVGTNGGNGGAGAGGGGGGAGGGADAFSACDSKGPSVVYGHSGVFASSLNLSALTGADGFQLDGVDAGDF